MSGGGECPDGVRRGVISVSAAVVSSGVVGFGKKVRVWGLPNYEPNYMRHHSCSCRAGGPLCSAGGGGAMYDIGKCRMMRASPLPERRLISLAPTIHLLVRGGDVGGSKMRPHECRHGQNLPDVRGCIDIEQLNRADYGCLVHFKILLMGRGGRIGRTGTPKNAMRNLRR